MSSCPICEGPDLERSGAAPSAYRCAFCGRFTFAGGEAQLAEVAGLASDVRAGLAWALHHRGGDEGIVLDRERASELARTAPRASPIERKNRVLLALGTWQTAPNGAVLESRLYRAWPLYRASTRAEVGEYLHWLESAGHVRPAGVSGDGVTLPGYKLTEAGWREVERLSEPNRDSKTAFVAMSFGRDVHERKQSARWWEHGFRAGVQRTGHEAVRIDSIQHETKICDAIVAEIRRARFIVADLTEGRPNVYYEAGLAHGLGITAILCCREPFFHEHGLAFDVRQYPVLLWNEAEELADLLAARIRAVVG